MITKYHPIRDWLRLLSPGIRAKLLAGMVKQHGRKLDRILEHNVSSLSQAIDDAVTWSSTAEGHAFWRRQHTKASRNARQPPEPAQDIDCTIPEGEA